MSTLAERRERMERGELNPTHGLASTYRTYGCRCQPCTEAHTARHSQELARRQERLPSMTATLPHGSASTYDNWGCRCEPCTNAKSEKNRGYYRKASS